MQPWFRFYREVLHDPKVQLLDPVLFKFWINCLCLASENDGYLPTSEAVSFAFHETLESVSFRCDVLLEVGLLDRKRGKLYLHNWHKRQYKSDSSTDRVRAFRKRFSNVTDAVTVTPPDTDTEQIQNQIQNRAEKKAAPSAWFDSVWADYPNKDGRKMALRAFTASVKSEADLERCRKALANYRHHLSLHPSKPIKNGSTWFNNWQDWENWVEPSTPTAPTPFRRPTEAEIQAAEARLNAARAPRPH